MRRRAAASTSRATRATSASSATKRLPACAGAAPARRLQRADPLDPRHQPRPVVRDELDALAPAALGEEVGERRREDRREGSRLERGRRRQHRPRGGVGAADRAAGIEREEPGGARRQHLARFVQRDDDVAAVLHAQQDVLDLRRRHRHQRGRVRVRQAAVAAGIEDAGDAAVGCEDRRRRAGEPGEAVEEMLVPDHGEALAQKRRRADPVGAAAILRPQAAGLDRAGEGQGVETLVGDRVEDQAVRRGQHERGAGARDRAMQEVDLDAGDAAQDYRAARVRATARSTCRRGRAAERRDRARARGIASSSRRCRAG